MSDSQNPGVPFMDLARLHAPLKEEILTKISSIIDRSAFVLGKEVEDLEAAFARYVGVPHAVGVSSGLDALVLALDAAGVHAGDEVIVPANTFIATAFAVSRLGAKPVLVDAEPESLNIDPVKARAALTPRTRAILPVHLYGQPATLAPLLDLAREKGLPLIEDCAQSHGARYHDQVTGSFGAAGCFSFYPGKNLGAFGEGGMITTRDPAMNERLRMLRDVGQKAKYVHEAIGYNARLHTIQAAALGVKLRHLEEHNRQRVAVARRYGELLSGVPGLTLPRVAEGRTHVYHLYVVQARDTATREGLRRFLGDRKIQTGLHYPTPIHLQKCYAQLGHGPGAFPVTERLCETCLSLPIFPGMTDAQVGAVAAATREFFKC